MSPSLITFLFEAANFVLLAALLSWLLFKPVRRALESRRAEERRMAEEAASKLAAAEALREETTREREHLAAELETMRSASRLEAKREADEILKEAEERMARGREQSERELEALREAQADRLAEAVVGATRELIRRFIAKVDSPSIDTALVQGACRQLETLEIGKESLSPVTVESAKVLDSESRSALQAALGGKAEGVEFRVVEELGAGVRVLTGQGLIDASWAGLADYAKRAVAAALRDRARGATSDG